VDTDFSPFSTSGIVVGQKQLEGLGEERCMVFERNPDMRRRIRGERKYRVKDEPRKEPTIQNR
jgi:hypothetical protein